MTATASKGPGRANNPPRKFHIVTHRVVDITALLHAEIPGREHWAKVHECGDKRAPVELPETRKRSWVK